MVVKEVSLVSISKLKKLLVKQSSWCVNNWKVSVGLRVGKYSLVDLQYIDLLWMENLKHCVDRFVQKRRHTF